MQYFPRYPARPQYVGRIGFTIVELLVVIVVIGILAAIIVTAFNGVQRNAVASFLQANLSSAARTFEIYKTTNASESYPADLIAAQLQPYEETNLQYTFYDATNSYCLTATSRTISYYIENGGKPTVGVCAGHTAGGGAPSAPLPTFQNLTASTLTSAGTRNWQGVTISDNGLKIAATTANGFVYTSTDAGVTWVERGPSGRLGDIAGSSDGTKLITFSQGGATRYIYVSSDSGVSWTTTAASCGGQCQLSAVAVSADGSIMAVIHGNGPNSGRLWTSSDTGATWTERVTGGPPFTDVAMSADGQTILIAPVGGYQIRKSINGGASFSSAAGLGASYWAVSCNTTCSGVVAARWGGGSGDVVSYSSDTMATLVTPSGLPATHYYRGGAAISDDGQKIVTGQDGGGIFTSTTATAFVARPSFGTTATTWKEFDVTPDGSTFIIAGHDTLLLGQWD
jgi:prepilin-type N-terminal cleavage/methylation domain-containing protein